MVMAKAASLELLLGGAKLPSGWVPFVLDWCEGWVEPPAGFDFEKARGVLRKKLADVESHCIRHEKRLDDKSFLDKASQETIAQITRKFVELQEQ